MDDTPVSTTRHIKLSAHSAERLSKLAQDRKVSEDQIIERALDILFSLTDILDEHSEQRGWSFVSEDSLKRIWDNEEDALP